MKAWFVTVTSCAAIFIAAPVFAGAERRPPASACAGFLVPPAARRFLALVDRTGAFNDVLSFDIRDQMLASRFDGGPGYVSLEMRTGEFVLNGSIRMDIDRTLEVRIHRFDSRLARAFGKVPGEKSLRSPVVGIWRGVLMGAREFADRFGAERIRFVGGSIWNRELKALLEDTIGFVQDDPDFKGYNQLVLERAHGPAFDGAPAPVRRFSIFAWLARTRRGKVTSR